MGFDEYYENDPFYENDQYDQLMTQNEEIDYMVRITDSYPHDEVWQRITGLFNGDYEEFVEEEYANNETVC